MKKVLKVCLLSSLFAMTITSCGNTQNSKSNNQESNSQSVEQVSNNDSVVNSQDESKDETSSEVVVSPDVVSSEDVLSDDDSSEDISESEYVSDEDSQSDEEISGDDSSSGEVQDEYTTIADFKKLGAEETATVKGLVTKILYDSSQTTMPYIMINDETGGIALYKKELQQVKEGDEIVVTGAYSLYKGTPELVDYTIDEVVSSDNEIPESWISETTVTDILQTPVTEENVGLIYKVACIPTQGNYSAYYLGELSGDNSLLTYSQSKYREYDFLKPYLTKPVELLVQLGIPRSSNGSYTWRVHPISYIGDYQIDYTDQMKGISTEPFTNFNSLYFEKGEASFISTSTLLEGATFEYSVDNNQIATITKNEDVYNLALNGVGKVNLTCTIKYQGSSIDVVHEIEVKEKPAVTATKVETVKTTSQDGDMVVLAGYVVGMVHDAGTNGLRKNAFYLMDDTGSMYVDLSQDMANMVQFKNGEYVEVEGEFDIYAAACNTRKVLSATILYRDDKVNDLPLQIATKTHDEMYNFIADNKNNRAGDVFYMNCIISKQDTTYGGTQYYVYDASDTNLAGNKKNIYKATGANLSYLDAHLDTPITVLMGIRDRKPELNSTELADGGYYRYDIIDGYYSELD